MGRSRLTKRHLRHRTTYSVSSVYSHVWTISRNLTSQKSKSMKAVKEPPLKANLTRLSKDNEWYMYKGRPAIPIGAETSRHYLIGTLTNSFNVILAGVTGSGKSMFFHSAIVHLLQNTKPDELKLVLIDPKQVELRLYENLPNLAFPVIGTAKEAKKALKWCVDEMNRRLETLTKKGKLVSFDDFNRKHKRKIPRIVVLIDECSDLMCDSPRFFRKAIKDILKLGEATGVSLAVGTSRPSLDVYPEKLVRSFEYKLAFKVSTPADSVSVLGVEGAEKLRGKGDMLFRSWRGLEERVVHLQGFYVSEAEIKKAIASIKPFKI